jgi:hypothetical protein
VYVCFSFQREFLPQPFLTSPMPLVCFVVWTHRTSCCRHESRLQMPCVDREWEWMWVRVSECEWEWLNKNVKLSLSYCWLNVIYERRRSSVSDILCFDPVSSYIPLPQTLFQKTYLLAFSSELVA